MQSILKKSENLIVDILIKHVAQFTILLTMLLAMLGGTVKLGLCPCHNSIFIGKCECDIQVARHKTCDDHESCKPGHHSSEKGDEAKANLAHHTPEKGGEAKGKLAHHKPEKGDKPTFTNELCDNLTTNTTEPFLFDSSVKIPDCGQLFPTAIIPSDHREIPLVSGQCLEPGKLRAPPDLFEDTRFAYTGFMRPELA